MCGSEFFKIIPMELQEKAMSRANLVESLSRRSSIFPGQNLPLDFLLRGSETEINEEQSEVNESSRTNIQFPYKEVTNENLWNIRNRLGIIDLSFSGIRSNEFVDKHPATYFTWTEKEQLLLVFAENFRRKYNELLKLRQPLMLAPKNECGIQVTSRNLIEL